MEPCGSGTSNLAPIVTELEERYPAWRAARDRHRPADTLPNGASDGRFEDRDELRCSLRSLHLHAPPFPSPFER